ncbi:AAA family ATPase [Labedaea rhizosphaerae]|uniref:AAA domain-containing protein n=1 Tax=Labedaea rhizosphaerae TaxID=598644 RepID=A0A4R6SQ78_LABRH|nr:AAA family ATPase [Labedaea rhizosphaerae]TDQ05682.1 AAA domain-containing protein [Labedaea rhizosphaerae]
MPTLIHLNGPSGIGKSTVAQLYADRHPGVLNLDTDRVVGLIGGWRQNFWQTLGPARALAIGMAETHLRGGNDVVMPQLVAKLSEIDRFEAAAAAAGADYRELVLLTDYDDLHARWSARPPNPVDEIMAEHGGVSLLNKIYGDLTSFVRDRPAATVIETRGQSVEETYQAVVSALCPLA